MLPEDKLQKLTERGWQQMRQTLDREMPVQSPRRRGWWFWLLPTAFLLAGSGYFLYQILNQKPAKKPASTNFLSVEPVASSHAGENLTDKNPNGESTTVEPTTNFSNQKTEKKQPTSEPKTSQKTGATTKNADVAKLNQGLRAQIAANNFEQLPLQNTLSQNPAADLQPTQVTERLAQFSDKTATAAEANLSSTAHPTFQKSPAEWATAPLPTQVFPINFENKNPKPFEKPTNPQMIENAKPALKLSLGATAGCTASNWWRPNGLWAGVVGDWKISTRWAVRAGLSYNRLTYKLTDGQVIGTKVSAPVFKDLTGQNALSSSTSTPNDMDTSQILVILPVNSLARIELPLQVQFFVNKKWFFSTGASIARTVGAGTTYEITGQSKNTAAADVETQLDRHVRLNTPNWAKFWTLGTGYKFSKQLEINLLIRQNLKKGHSATWIQHDSNFADAADLGYHSKASTEVFDLQTVSYKKLKPELQVGLVWKFLR